MELEEIEWEGVNWIHLSELIDCMLYNVKLSATEDIQIPTFSTEGGI